MTSSAAPVRKGSWDHRILDAATAVTAAALVVKLAATAKEFTVAEAFGRSDALESFLAAALIPGLLINLISESMNQALVPSLMRVKEREGRESAQQLFSASMLCNIVILVASSLVMAISARYFIPLIASHFSTPKLNLAVRLFYGLLPAIVFSGIASNFAVVLNTEGRFAMPALAPIATPLAIMVAIPLFSGEAGVWAIVYATVIGSFISVVWMGSMLKANGYRAVPRWYGMTKSAREVAAQYGVVLLSGLVASGGLLVDQSMAAMLPAGSVSALVYAGRFVGVALTLLGGAASSAAAPLFSEMVVRNDWSGCRRSLRIWATASAVVTSLVAGALILAAHLLVRLTLQHGAFGAQDTSAVSRVLIMYALQIPFFVSSRVFYRFLLAMRRADLVFYCGLLNLVLDVALNLLLMRSMGVAGIALATSLWTVSTFVFLCYWSWKVLPCDGEALPNLRG
ncbi:lipid II flippase MurJ [Telmatobacter sp. DSM 110680]|uniref:Lipid II flippase MurJ n=1 Tax=Telmatobacter sp. DSM 110680 TaxID=3036704 RepID=A0AAU7DFT3_9BACT